MKLKLNEFWIFVYQIFASKIFRKLKMLLWNQPLQNAYFTSSKKKMKIEWEQITKYTAYIPKQWFANFSQSNNFFSSFHLIEILTHQIFHCQVAVAVAELTGTKLEWKLSTLSINSLLKRWNWLHLSVLSDIFSGPSTAFLSSNA